MDIKNIMNFSALSTGEDFSILSSIRNIGLIDSLVVEHDVWQPDVSGGHVQHVHPPILLRLPHQLVVIPEQIFLLNS